MNKRAPLIAGGIVAVVLLLIVVGLIMPRSGQNGTAKDTLAQLQADETAKQAQLRNLEELQQQLSAFQRRLDANEALVPNTADTPGLIRILRLVADKTGVDFAVLSQGAPAVQDPVEFSSISVSISISGRLDQVGQYLYEVEHLERAIKVISLTMTPEPDTGIIVGTMTANTYTTDTSTGPTGLPGSQGPGEEPA